MKSNRHKGSDGILQILETAFDWRSPPQVGLFNSSAALGGKVLVALGDDKLGQLIVPYGVPGAWTPGMACQQQLGVGVSDHRGSLWPLKRVIYRLVVAYSLFVLRSWWKC